MTANYHKAEIDLIRQYKEMIKIIERQIDQCVSALTTLWKEHFLKEYKRGKTIPSVKEHTATAFISETGTDISISERP